MFFPGSNGEMFCEETMLFICSVFWSLYPYAYTLVVKIIQEQIQGSFQCEEVFFPNLVNLYICLEWNALFLNGLLSYMA